MKYELFILKTCPFCKKVLNYLEGKDFDVELLDIENSENEAKLIEVGGKRQVPCLFIDGEPMYESDDIVNYFKGLE